MFDCSDVVTSIQKKKKWNIPPAFIAAWELNHILVLQLLHWIWDIISK